MSSKKDDEKKLSPVKVAQMISLSLEGTARDFVSKWNAMESAVATDVRFNLDKRKVPVKLGKKEGIQGQAVLSMDMKIDLIWTNIVRKVMNFPTIAEMEKADNDGLLTLALWSDMFAEVTHLGFIAALTATRQRQQQTDHATKQKSYPYSPDQAVSEAHRLEDEAVGATGN